MAAKVARVHVLIAACLMTYGFADGLCEYAYKHTSMYDYVHVYIYIFSRQKKAISCAHGCITARACAGMGFVAHGFGHPGKNVSVAGGDCGALELGALQPEAPRVFSLWVGLHLHSNQADDKMP